MVRNRIRKQSHWAAGYSTTNNTTASSCSFPLPIHPPFLCTHLFIACQYLFYPSLFPSFSCSPNLYYTPTAWAQTIVKYCDCSLRLVRGGEGEVKKKNIKRCRDKDRDGLRFEEKFHTVVSPKVVIKLNMCAESAVNLAYVQGQRMRGKQRRGGEERCVPVLLWPLSVCLSLFSLMTSHTLHVPQKGRGLPVCCFLSSHTASLCMTHYVYPYTPPLLLFPDLPVVLHSATILHTSSRHPLLFSCHPFSLPSNPLSSSTAVPSLSYFCTWTPFLPLFPLYQSCLTALTMILLFHPGWPVNSHLPFLS